MTKEELLEIAEKSYFKRDPELRLMYATADGNFFFPAKAHYGRAHARATGFELLMIENPAYAVEEEKEVKPETEKKEEPKAEAPKKDAKADVKPKATRRRTTKKKD
jgi:hypothetical protein